MKRDFNIVMLERKVLGMDMDMSVFSGLGRVTEYDVSSPEQVSERVGDANCIIVNKLPMDAAHLDPCPNVELILEAATGTDNIDLDYCKRRGITVKNVKGYSTQMVAQHTFALYMYLAEHLPWYDDYVKSGSYSSQKLFSCFDNYFGQLAGRTWGIVGLGEIGRRVYEIAAAFGARPIAYSPSGGRYPEGYTQVDLDELLEKSHVISIHTPLTDVTRGLFDYGLISRMRRDAILINVARGPLVRDEDLARALDEGLIAGAGLDVMGREPIEEDSPLLRLSHPERIIITPHMAWGSVEARTRLVEMIYENAVTYLEGR